jgi:hypothetical protein
VVNYIGYRYQHISVIKTKCIILYTHDVTCACNRSNVQL